MNRLILRAAIGLGTVLGLTGVVAGPASATWGQCSISYICMWGGSNYSGAPWFEHKNLGLYPTGYFNNDETSSVANKSSISSLMVYDKSGGRSDGGVGCLPRNYSQRNLGDENPTSWQDRISSARIISGACPDGVDYLGYPLR